MKARNPVPELMDIESLALHLNDSVRHVRRLVAERRIPYLKVGHFIRFDPEDVNQWLRAQRVHENTWRFPGGRRQL